MANAIRSTSWFAAGVWGCDREMYGSSAIRVHSGFAVAGSGRRRIRLLALVVFLVAGLLSDGRLPGDEPCVDHAAAPVKRVLLLAQGPDGHPVATHEYVAGLQILKCCLDRAPGVQATLVKADEPWPAGPELIDQADGVVLYLSEGAKWFQQDLKRLAALQRLANRGGGCGVIHWGMGCKEARHIAAFVPIFGGCHGGPDRQYKVLTARPEVALPEHPINTRVVPAAIEEEFYYRLKFAGPAESVRPLLRVDMDGAPQTVGWAWERPDGGRAFGFSGGHFHRNWGQPFYRRFVAQGVLWTLKLPIPPEGLDVEVAANALRLE